VGHRLGRSLRCSNSRSPGRCRRRQWKSTPTIIDSGKR
jgi:hypothetical protein